MAKLSAGVKGGKNLLDMLFLHNTDASKLARIEQMGGMPMPSVAVTRKDIPLEDYGDITLIGRKDALDPAIKANKLYSGDAYTVRAPQPIRLANKKAYRQLDEDYAEFSDVGNVDYMRQVLGDLESKSRASSSSFAEVERFFEESPAVIAKFAKENGLEIPMRSGRVDTWALRDIRKNNEFAFKKFSQDEMNKYLQPEQYFDANPNRDYVTGRASLKPYTADNITAYMKKNAGRAEESSMAQTGTGANRAAVTEQLKSLDAARAKRDMLMPEDAAKASHEELSNRQYSIMEALKPYYQYDSEGYGYLDEAGSMLIDMEKKGASKAMREYGFENVPQSLLDEIASWKRDLRNAPTQYFEGKPERTVGLGEFAGAIVPENTPQNLIDMLGRYGVDVQKYTDDAQRTALRDKYSSEMFVRPETVAATGLLANIQGTPESQASDLASYNQGVTLDSYMSQLGADKKPDIYNYSNILPVKRNKVTGDYSYATTGILEEMLRGLLDIGESRKSGVITNPNSILDVLL